MLETILVGRKFCHSCVIGCGRRIAPSHNAWDIYLANLGFPFEEIGFNIIDKYLDNEEMAEIYAILMDYRALYSSIIMCSMCNPPPSQNTVLIEYTTGLKFGIPEVKLYCERILNMKRMFNIKMGLTSADDRLPKILTRSFDDGGTAGKTPNFEQLKKLFYEYRDWDVNTGTPNDSKLKTLGLDNL